jgi:hypothetical protein
MLPLCSTGRWNAVIADGSGFRKPEVCPDGARVSRAEKVAPSSGRKHQIATYVSAADVISIICAALYEGAVIAPHW